MNINKFPKEIHEQLGYYIYRLIDPRDGSTFYVGKGYGDRVFNHINDALEYEGDEDEASAKIKTLRQIRNTGLEPLHIIHRHNLTEEQAFLTEAVVIDMIPGLSNEVGGHGSNQYGPANSQELINRYKIDEMVIHNGHRIIAINVNRSIEDREFYDAVRCAWRISLERAQKADYIFAMKEGICREVFIADEWMPATQENFPGILNESVAGRYGFTGRKAPDEIRQLYVNKRMPEEMQRRKGMASPILYNYS